MLRKVRHQECIGISASKCKSVHSRRDEGGMQLGKRYLCVDRYCVNQHEHDINNIQIGEMD
jgi:hypothetical protein